MKEGGSRRPRNVNVTAIVIAFNIRMLNIGNLPTANPVICAADYITTVGTSSGIPATKFLVESTDKLPLWPAVKG